MSTNTTVSTLRQRMIGHDGTQARAPFAAQPHPQLQAICSVLEALARVAISNRRLVAADDGGVALRWISPRWPRSLANNDTPPP